MNNQGAGGNGCGEKTWQAWEAIQRIFDDSPANYRQIVARIERCRSTESAIDVLVKMVLRYEADPRNYTWPRIRWAITKVDGDARRKLKGRSHRREEAMTAYRGQLADRRARINEELASVCEAAEMVDVLREVVLPTLPAALGAGMLDVMADNGLTSSAGSPQTTRQPTQPTCPRTRQWRAKQAKKLAAKRLAAFGAVS